MYWQREYDNNLNRDEQENDITSQPLLYEDDDLDRKYDDEKEQETEEYNDPDNSIRLHVDKKYGVVCYFRRQDKVTSGYLWNRLAAMRTKSEWIHSEFYFTKHDTTLSVDSAHPVYMRRGGNKYNDTSKWEGRVIWLPREQYYRVYRFCKSQLGRPFDTKGIYCYDLRELCTLPFGQVWVCSRLMTSALVSNDVLPPNINPMKTSPALLMDRLNELEKDGRYSVEIYEM